MNNYLDKEINKIIEKYSLIGEKYNKFEEIIGLNNTEELVKFSQEFKRKISVNIEKDRNLRIGIVGQMKAGKSSFLNALLFDGKDLLPKAATPMTAALTKILYSENPKAVVEFYTEEEWKVVEDTAKRYDNIIDETRKNIIKEKQNANKNLIIRGTEIVLSMARKDNMDNQFQKDIIVTDEEVRLRARIPEEVKSAKELYNMFLKNGLEIEKDKYLGKEKIIEDIVNLKDLVGKLNTYVGAEGKYTPIVKSSKLYINDERLKNIEVIDTPGVNDPILSRGMATKRFLAQCDVVFLLSYAGQFMDSSDVGYLLEKLPNEGIKNIILLGSKFDSALLDEGDKYDRNLLKALRGISLKLEKQANSIIEPLKLEDPNNNIYKNIEKSMPPKFISSMAYNMSQHINNLNKEEEHILNRLKCTFPSVQFTESLLKDLANIDNIKNQEFPKIIIEKENILNSKFNDLVEGQKRSLKSKLINLKDESEVKLNSICNEDKESLNKKYNNIKLSTEKARDNVDMIFDDVMTDIKKKFALLKSDLKIALNQYQGIQTKSGSYEESYEVSVSKWYKPWSWGKTETRYRTIEYSYANVYDAVENISNFALKAEKDIQNQLLSMFNLDKLRSGLINAIINVFDLSDENFNEYEILNPVNKVVNNITIPDVEFDSDKYEKMILSKFNNSVVKNDDIIKLKEKYKDVMMNILQDIREVIDMKVNFVINNLQNTGENFMNRIDSEVKGNIEELKNQLDNKARYEALYTELIEKLKVDIDSI